MHTLIGGSESGTVNNPLYCKTVEGEAQQLCEWSITSRSMGDSEFFVCNVQEPAHTHQALVVLNRPATAVLSMVLINTWSVTTVKRGQTFWLLEPQ